MHGEASVSSKAKVSSEANVSQCTAGLEDLFDMDRQMVSYILAPEQVDLDVSARAESLYREYLQRHHPMYAMIEARSYTRAQNGSPSVSQA